MSSEEPVLSDEQILEFEQQIKDEEAQKVNEAYCIYLNSFSFRFLLYVRTSLSVSLK